MATDAPVSQVVAGLLVCNALSIGMTLFAKWFLHQWNGTGYPFAITMTLASMLIKWCVSSAIQNCWARRKSRDSHRRFPSVSRRVYWTLVVPIAVCSSLDPLLANIAFYYATVSFSTVVKSTQNVWTLLFSIWLGHQRFSWKIVAAIGLIGSGVALASVDSAQFDARGFCLLLGSTIFGTLQWVLTQSLLGKLDDATSSPVLTTVYLTSPASVACLLPAAVVFEGQGMIHSEVLHDPALLVESSLWLVVGGVLVSALTISKVLLVHTTSALTLGISGSFRDVTLILVAVVCFGDQISGVNALGLTAVLLGVFLYTLLKHCERPQRQSLASQYEAHLTDSTSKTDVVDMTSVVTVSVNCDPDAAWVASHESAAPIMHSDDALAGAASPCETWQESHRDFRAF